MGAGHDGSRVIGEDHHFVILAAVLKIVEHYGQHSLVDKLDSPDLILRLVAVAALIGGFKVDINQIAAVFPFLDRRLSLALKIRVDITRCALDLGGIHAGADAYALEQVDRRDDAAFNAVELLKRLKRGRLPSPQSQIEFAGDLPSAILLRLTG